MKKNLKKFLKENENEYMVIDFPGRRELGFGYEFLEKEDIEIWDVTCVDRDCDYSDMVVIVK